MNLLQRLQAKLTLDLFINRMLFSNGRRRQHITIRPVDMRHTLLLLSQQLLLLLHNRLWNIQPHHSRCMNHTHIRILLSDRHHHIKFRTFGLHNLWYCFIQIIHGNTLWQHEPILHLSHILCHHIWSPITTSFFPRQSRLPRLVRIRTQPGCLPGCKPFCYPVLCSLPCNLPRRLLLLCSTSLIPSCRLALPLWCRRARVCL
mmetsp:Transcript_205/g.455  ORF Transcript_205/g.455 Transcript_205/m.455 type:complete len:202 (+) Transcript_205:234-839(+)